MFKNNIDYLFFLGLLICLFLKMFVCYLFFEFMRYIIILILCIFIYFVFVYCYNLCFIFDIFLNKCKFNICILCFIILMV